MHFAYKLLISRGGVETKHTVSLVHCATRPDTLVSNSSLSRLLVTRMLLLISQITPCYLLYFAQPKTTLVYGVKSGQITVIVPVTRKHLYNHYFVILDLKMREFKKKIL